MTTTTLAQQALLVLAGHLNPSSDLKPSPELVHPAATCSLSRLQSIAQLHFYLNQFTHNHLILQSSPVLASLASAINRELAHYQSDLAKIEHCLLGHHPTLVPYNSDLLPSPPVSAILAELHPWHQTFTALHGLLTTIQARTHPPWSSPELIELLHQHALSGSPQLSAIFSRIQLAIEQLWIQAIRSFVIYGQRPLEHPISTNPDAYHQQLIDDLFLAQRPRQPGSGLDQPKHQPLTYLLKPNALPQLPSLNPHGSLLRSMVQICHALTILSHLRQPNSTRLRSSTARLALSKFAMPSGLQAQLTIAFSDIDRISHPGFRHAIQAVQDILSDHLFTVYLTPDILRATLRSLADVFLLQHPVLTSNLVTAFARLRTTRLRQPAHRSRRPVTLSERELDVLLLKAALSTDIEPPVDLIGFSFTILPSCTHPHHLFAGLVLDPTLPVLLTFAPSAHLSLFLTDQACGTYSLIHSCLLTFLLVRDRLKQSWLDLSRRQRSARRWAANATGKSSCWETRRLMGWWVDEMISHIWMHVITPSLTKLVSDLEAVPRLDFRTLASLHAGFLARLTSGICLTEVAGPLASCVRLCEDLEGAATELFPDLLESSPAERGLKERVEAHGVAFKRELGVLFTRLSALVDEDEAGSGFRRVVVGQLLNRLDFTGFFSDQQQEGEDEADAVNVLGGL
ncbi:hypothetical protein CROQUDRAFT_87422 [Cronartium quercuum f. sp. fusiforme G11]|uniref:Spindle pole body component n=1 Tax=Cronartium quercuum f. sp. fusiforme G11 TaxID=708437 RepID=A0A9P6NVA9_9BASI|nr:hypothetical protein CROQUDRAFT_87422 [Cronartium quercuum f. sp. fusiforme G11]